MVIDGRTFLRPGQVRSLLDLAGSLGERPRIIECVCDDAVAKERLERDLAGARHPAGNRTFALYLSLKAAAEPILVPHLVLDTSHAAVAKHDLVEVRKLFGDRLRHVHLSDNSGKGWDSHLPPGEGVLDLDTFLRDLRDCGFAGTVSLEVDLRKRTYDPAGLRSLLVSMRERVESELGERGRDVRYAGEVA